MDGMGIGSDVDIVNTTLHPLKIGCPAAHLYIMLGWRLEALICSRRLVTLNGGEK